MQTAVIASPIFTRSGYGVHSWSIAKALIQSEKYDVKLIPLPWGNTPQVDLDPNNPEHKMMLDRVLQGQLAQKPDLWIQISIPSEFQRNGEVNLGITAGIESTLTRVEWIEGLNRMDLNIVTSQFSADVFRRNRFEKRNKQTQQPEGILELTKPMEVLFEGVNPLVFDKTKPGFKSVNDALKGLPEFCFLSVGHWLQGNLSHDRKDIGMLVKVFLDTFKRKKKRPALILKTSTAGFSITEYEVIRDKIEQIQDMIRNEGWKGDFPEIHILYGELSDDEMNALYNHPKVKAMVSFTHGEGFGRPLLEFTTTGKPLICSGWSGQMDFLHPEFAFLLPGDLVKVDRSAQNDWLVKDAEWFRVNYPYASQIMMQCFEQYDKFLEKSRKHRKYTMDNFTEEKMSSKFLEILENNVKLEEKPKMIKLNLPKLTKVE